jgi:WD40 repeat protein
MIKILKILSGGAEQGYASMAFNRTGQSLASVATAPDYMLTIWDWEEESMGLHCKAFGQDVFNVKFSLDDDYRLTTSGVGHIRFWKIASTFTGLKLQGAIGKFGKIELSDITSFCDLPDGKVVSGTEFGSLLLWEGNFIKCRFVLSTGLPCHEGEITSVEYDRQEKCILTIGVDGFMKCWSFRVIDSAEIDSDNSMDFVLTPLAQFKIGNDEGIQNVLDSGNYNKSRLIIYKTKNGTVKSCKFDLRSKGSDVQSSFLTVIQSVTASSTAEDNSSQPTTEAVYFKEPVHSTLLSGHVGAVTGVDTCPCGPYAASCDEGGNIFLWDFRRKKEVTVRSFENDSATCLTWLPMECSGSSVGSSFAVGFKSGLIRIFNMSQSATKGLILSLSLVLKSHDAAVTCISFSSKGQYVGVSGTDGTIFFFKTSQMKSSIAWTPIRFISLRSQSSSTNIPSADKKDLYCNSMQWSSDSSTILCSCQDSIIREVVVRDVLAMDTSYIESYEASAPIKEISMKIQDPNMLMTAKESAAAIMPPTGEETPGKIVGSSTSNHQHSGTHASAISRRGSVDRSTRSSVASNEFVVTAIPMLPLYSSVAVYTTGRRAGGILTSSYIRSESPSYHLYEASTTFSDGAAHEVSMGLYSSDGKDFSKSPKVTCMKHSWSGKLVAHGAADGSIAIRPSSLLELFGRTVAHSNLGVSAAAISYDYKFMISGGKDGVIVIHRLRTDIFFSDIPTDLARDIDAGIFKAYETSGKQPHLLSSTYTEPPYLRVVRSEDNLDEHFPAVQTDGDKLSEKLVLDVSSTDIALDVESSCYSIQQEKLRQGEDVRLSAAEIVKARTREQVQELRRRFDFLCRQNDSLPEAVRLPREKLMEVDGDYWNILLRKREELVEEVHREYAYEMEKSVVLKNKIKNSFMKGLLVEEMKLSSFPSTDPEKRNKFSQSILPYVLSLRAHALDDQVVEILDDLRRRGLHPDQIDAKNAIGSATNAVEDSINQQSSLNRIESSSSLTTGNLKSTTIVDQTAVPSTAMSHTNAEAGNMRRELRKQRLEHLKVHESKKPKDDEDDVRDIEAIRNAEKTLGNYKLKIGDDYEIDEENLVNVSKKRVEMALLEEKMLIMRLAFDEKFLELRQEKYAMIDEIGKYNHRIRAINAILDQEHLSYALIDHQHDPEEYPDDRDEVTAEELEEYRQQRGVDAEHKQGRISWEKVVPPSHHVITGKKTLIVKDEHGRYILSKKPDEAVDIQSFRQMELKLATKLPPPPSSSSSTVVEIEATRDGEIAPDYVADERVFKNFYKSNKTSRKERENLAMLENVLPHLRVAKLARQMQLQTREHGDISGTILMERKKELMIERDALLKIITNKIDGFNKRINQLILERHQLIFDLKLLELRLSVLNQEYQILLTYEDRDIALQQRQQQCRGEQDEISNNMNEVKSKLDAKVDEQGVWQNKLSTLLSELKTTVPDSHPHHDILIKIFKKKVKRAAKSSMNNSYMDDGNEDEDYYEDEEDDDDDDDDYDDVEDICPAGCEAVLYERVVNLREKRVHIEEMLQDINKAIDDQRKAFERYKQREKQIVKDVHQTEVEVRQFHLQKQAALNQIPIVVPLKLSQIYAFEGSGAFTKPSDSVGKEEDGVVEDSQTAITKSQLKDANARRLAESVGVDTHVLFRKE